MFFDTWFHGIIFGLVTTVVLLIIATPIAGMWKKYENSSPKPPVHCEQHH